MTEHRDEPAADDAAAPLWAWLHLEYDEEQQWRDLVPGPAVDAVATRLGSIPSDFLDERVDVAALSGDVLGPLDGLGPVLGSVSAFPAARQGAAVALWLFASQRVIAPLEPVIATTGADRAMAALGLRLAPVVPPLRWLTDVTRREEAARLFLLWCGAQPRGEDAETSRGIARRLDSLARHEQLASMAAEHAHRLEVQRRLRAERARESAARYNYE